MSETITGAMKHPFHLLKCLSLTALAAAIISIGPARGADDPPSAGVALPDLSGRMVHPFDDPRAKAVVFIFVGVDCPISNRYAPELKRLQKLFAAKHVRFHLVFPGKDETTAAIQAHLREYGYSPYALRDPKQDLVKLAGAQVTPEAAVFAPGNSGYRIVYRGRIDDRVIAFGKVRPAPRRRDLRLAIEAILKGNPLAFTTQPAIGCFISKNDER